MHSIKLKISSYDRPLLVNSAFLILNTFVASLLGFIFWIIAARGTSASQVGIGAAYFSALTFLVNLGQMGLGITIIKFLTKMGSRQTEFINSSLIFVACWTMIFTCIFIFGVPFWTPNLIDLYQPSLFPVLFIGSTISFGLADLLDKLYISFEVTYYLFARTILSNLLRLIVVLPFAFALGAIGFPIAVGFGALISFCISLLYFAPKVLIGFRPSLKFDRSIIQNSLHFSLGNHLSLLLWNAPPQIFPLIILALLGPESNAIFYVSWMMANLLFIISFSVSTSAFARASNDSNFQSVKYWHALWITILSLIPLASVMILLSGILLQIFGQDYYSGKNLFIFLVISSLPYSINNFFIVYFRIFENIKIIVLLSVSITFISVALVICFGFLYGLTGVGFGWFLGQLFGVGLSWLRYARAKQEKFEC